MIISIYLTVASLVIAVFGLKFYPRLVQKLNVWILKENIALLLYAFEDQESIEPIRKMLLRLQALGEGEMDVRVHRGHEFGFFVPEGESECILLPRYAVLNSLVLEGMMPIWLAGEMAESAAFHNGYDDLGSLGECQKMLEIGEILILVYKRLKEINHDFGGHPDIESLEEALHYYEIDRDLWVDRSHAELVAIYPTLAPAIAAIRA